MQDRITELEIKVAHAEQALTELSDVLYGQQQLIDQLGQRMEALQQRLDAADGAAPGAETADEKPPHY
jgi:uncharacterized coiled-coil protein SlyX